jgi:DNA-directed RNA polymerase specialized sigma24 family protein
MLGTDALFATSFVKTLTRTDRLVLMLFYAEQLNTAEIGQVLELSELTVEDRLDDLQDRARMALTLSGEPSLA